MQISCPKGYGSDLHAGNITFRLDSVNICAGTCDCCDLCGIRNCEFFDLSVEATRRHMAGAGFEYTIDGIREVKRLRELLDEGLDPVMVLKHMARYPDRAKTT